MSKVLEVLDLHTLGFWTVLSALHTLPIGQEHPRRYRALHGELGQLPPAELEANHYSEIPVLTEAGTT